MRSLSRVSLFGMPLVSRGGGTCWRRCTRDTLTTLSPLHIEHPLTYQVLAVKKRFVTGKGGGRELGGWQDMGEGEEGGGIKGEEGGMEERWARDCEEEMEIRNKTCVGYVNI